MLRAFVLALAALWMSSGAAAAQESQMSEAERIGRAYMAAYSAAEWDAMAPYMADDFQLIDRTNPDPTFVPVHDTPQVALQMMREFGAANGVTELGLDFPTVFESNNIVVFIGFANVRGEPPGRDYGFLWRAEQVTALTVRDGKITRHEDFANYTHAVATRLPRTPN